MSVDNRFMIKRLQGLEEMFVSFAQTTRMPFVECDEETFDDQVYLFADEDDAKNWAREYGEKNIPLTGWCFTMARDSPIFPWIRSCP